MRDRISFALGFSLRATLTVALAACLAGPATAAETYKEHFDHSYPLSTGGTFTLRDVNGGVAVTTWDRNEIHVVADKQVRAGNAEEGRRRLAELRIEVSQQPGTLRVDTRFPHHTGGFFGWLSGEGGGSVAVSYRIEVPRGARVDVETVNGALSVAGTTGDLRAETTNGGVDVKGTKGGKIHLESTNGAISVVDTAGAVVAETTNGSIEVELKQVPKAEPRRFSTTNGHISLKVPHDIQASISASTTNGSVSTDLPVAARGKVTRHHLDADVNGGGGKLQLSTTNGGINITSLQ